MFCLTELPILENSTYVKKYNFKSKIFFKQLDQTAIS